MVTTEEELIEEAFRDTAAAEADFAEQVVYYDAEQDYSKGWSYLEIGDEGKALPYFKNAAELGHVGAKFYLAMYYTSQQDYDTASYWMQKS